LMTKLIGAVAVFGVGAAGQALRCFDKELMMIPSRASE